MANQEPFSFGNGKRAQEQVPHSGVHHDERPFEESDIPLSQARLKIPEGSRDITPLTQPADVKQEAPVDKTPESFIRKHRRGIAALVTTAVVGGVGGGLLAMRGDESAGPGTKEPGISKVDTEVLQQKDRPIFPPNILEGAKDGEWGSIFNKSIREDLNWYLGTIIDHPEIPANQIPVDSFTDTPNGEVVTLLRNIGEQILADNPDALDIGTFVCPTASDDVVPQDYGCELYSSFNYDPKKYPDLSYLRVEYTVQDQDGQYSEHKSFDEKLTQPYHLEQQPDGTLKINEG